MHFITGIRCAKMICTKWHYLVIYEILLSVCWCNHAFLIYHQPHCKVNFRTIKIVITKAGTQEANFARLIQDIHLVYSSYQTVDTLTPSKTDLLSFCNWFFTIHVFREFAFRILSKHSSYMFTFQILSKRVCQQGSLPRRYSARQ